MPAPQQHHANAAITGGPAPMGPMAPIRLGLGLPTALLALGMAAPVLAAVPPSSSSATVPLQSGPGASVATTERPQGSAAPTAATGSSATAGATASAPLAPREVSNTVIALSLGRREISLVRDGKVEGRWPVVIGAPETPTPTGHFKVLTKVVNPIYRSTKTGQIKGVVGPQGPLGDRWIGFHSTGKDEFGIHGTPWPWWVDARAAVSHGCVRMRNEHVHQLFEAVEVGTPVEITR